MNTDAQIKQILQKLQNCNHLRNLGLSANL
jgi:hypothetical protein